MQVLEAAAARTANPWPLRRERAAELAERYPHAAEMLRLYQALTVVQEAVVQIPPELFPSPSGGGQGGGSSERGRLLYDSEGLVKTEHLFGVRIAFQQFRGALATKGPRVGGAGGGRFEHLHQILSRFTRKALNSGV